MDRAEGAGLSVAVLGHLALFGLLSVGFLATPNPLKLKPEPIEVSITDDVGLESQAPVPSHETPAARLAPEAPAEPNPAPPQPAPAPEPVAQPKPTPPQPAPAPAPAPVPKPAPAPKPAAHAAPATKPAPAAAAAKSTSPPRRPVQASGALDGIVNGLASTPTKGHATTPPAATAGPEVKSALVAELVRKVRPFWTAPTGADADKLRTVIRVQLARDGSIQSVGECQQSGITASNRAQAELHCERAQKAVRLAAPYNTFPDKYYDAWKVIFPAFDWRLSR